MKPVFSAFAIASENLMISSKLAGGEARVLEHQLVVEQQRLGDIEGNQVVLLLVEPARQVVGIEEFREPAVRLEIGRQVQKRAVGGPLDPDLALQVDNVGRGAGHK